MKTGRSPPAAAGLPGPAAARRADPGGGRADAGLKVQPTGRRPAQTLRLAVDIHSIEVKTIEDI